MPLPPAAPGQAVPSQAVPSKTAPSHAAPDSDAILSLIRASLDDMKAEETVEIDLRGKTSLADAMVVTSGRSSRQVGSIAERVLHALKEGGVRSFRVEGMPHNDWVLIDAGDVILHVFRPEVRGFYNLEKIWGADRPDEQRLTG